MTDQEKLERVLDGLERCKEGSILCFGESECGYQSYFPRCWITLASDALALLKAQETRVMTATEAYTADYVYIEFDGVITPAIRTTNERDDHRESYFATQQLGGDWMRWDDYGITWRCWTSRPSKEEMEVTSWN